MSRPSRFTCRVEMDQWGKCAKLLNYCQLMLLQRSTEWINKMDTANCWYSLPLADKCKHWQQLKCTEMAQVQGLIDSMTGKVDWLDGHQSDSITAVRQSKYIALNALLEQIDD